MTETRKAGEADVNANIKFARDGKVSATAAALRVTDQLTR